MNEQVMMDLIQRPQYDRGIVEFKTLITVNTSHIPSKGDVLTLGDWAYIVYEVAWNFDDQGLTSVNVYLDYDGEL
jgi:hypothetical protein